VGSGKAAGWRYYRGQPVAARQLPCVFGDALTALNAALDELDPVLTLAIGQAGGRVDITVERVAINVDDARIPDNKGLQPIDVPIAAGGPAAYFSTLPIKAIVTALRSRGSRRRCRRRRGRLSVIT
jgi:pyroglutamyl-peptidase